MFLDYISKINFENKKYNFYDPLALLDKRKYLLQLL